MILTNLEFECTFTRAKLFPLIIGALPDVLSLTVQAGKRVCCNPSIVIRSRTATPAPLAAVANAPSTITANRPHALTISFPNRRHTLRKPGALGSTYVGLTLIGGIL